MIDETVDEMSAMGPMEGRDQGEEVRRVVIVE